MTPTEKTNVAAFFDLADDYLSGGYKRLHKELAFSGDTPPPSLEPQRDIKPASKIQNTEKPPAPQAEKKPNAGDSLNTVAADIASCTRCGLCSTRTNTVPGEGVTQPLVMVIGEGPGEDEDRLGRPFVGRAGQLLDRMLDSKGRIGLSRNTNCYIANVLKCRPPGNRNPQPDEISACIPYLTRQITLLRPKIILAAGNTAAKALLGSTDGITRLRGIVTVFRGTLLMDGDFNIPLLPTFHPSALLRDESLKAPVWEDMKTLRKKLCELDGAFAERMAAIPI